MINIIKKEVRLSASPLAFIFILFGLMFFLPGYPVLCGAFFVTLGIYQSFQYAREANDIMFSVLLPIAKKDIVKGKFLFVCLIELCSTVLMITAVIIRMTVLSNAPAYRNNALMNANFFALGTAFLIFGLFNLIFLGGFFKTSYNLGRPFIINIITTFTVIGISEALHHFPRLEFLNAFGTEYLKTQLILLSIGFILFITLTTISLKKSYKRFENTDL